MGHYDDAYDRHYEEEFAAEKRKRERDIPLVVADLVAARDKLRRATGHVEHALRFEEEISIAILALKGQLA